MQKKKKTSRRRRSPGSDTSSSDQDQESTETGTQEEEEEEEAAKRRPGEQSRTKHAKRETKRSASSTHPIDSERPARPSSASSQNRRKRVSFEKSTRGMSHNSPRSGQNLRTGQRKSGRTPGQSKGSPKKRALSKTDSVAKTRTPSSQRTFDRYHSSTFESPGINPLSPNPISPHGHPLSPTTPITPASTYPSFHSMQLEVHDDFTSSEEEAEEK